MTRLNALNAARKLLGKTARIEENPRAPAAEDRKAASARLAELREVGKGRKLTSEEIVERRKCQGLALSYRYSVGTLGGFADFGLFFIQGQGDTWEEAIAKARESVEAEKARNAELRAKSEGRNR